MSIRIRPATADDYATFVRLFPELEVPDPTPAQDRWAADMAPSSWIAEDETGPKGVVYVNVYEDTGYVRIIIVDPTARRSGIGRALMETARARFLEARCTKWCLNTYPHNVKAIGLYESLGLRRSHEMIVVRLPWSALDGRTPAPQAAVRTPADGEHAAIERALGLLPGELATFKDKPERPMFVVESVPAKEILGAALMDPRFPGSKPFRVLRPELATTLLLAMRAHALPDYDHLNLPIDDQPELAQALVALGGKETMRTQHMKGVLSR